MFYTGDLQSGLSLAVSQSKLVGCFVHDDSETSKIWEEEFLTNEDLPVLLGERVVLLRLKQGSVEAGFLAKMYPIYQTPTFVLLGAGQLKVYITSNPPVSKDDFTARVKTAIQSDQPETSTSNPAQATTPAPQASSSSKPAPSQTLTPTPPQPSASVPAPNTQPSPTSQLFDDQAQAAKLAADKAARDQAIKAAAAAKAAEAKATQESSRPSNANKKANLDYAKQRSERIRKDRDDLANIKKKIEDDKVERKAREAERKALEKALKASSDKDISTTEKGKEKEKENLSKTNNKETTTAIQIRLFDGSTIRSRFPTTNSLHDSIRPWISENLTPENKNTPYTFKHVLTPLPNRTIEISEEEKEIGKGGLGFVPSATLILVPVQGVGVVEAYGGGSGGIVGSGMSLIGSGVGMVGSVIGSVLGGLGLIGGNSNANPPVKSAGSRESGSSGSGTGSSGVRREEREFYNGNNLSFEPRRDGDDDEGTET